MNTKTSLNLAFLSVAVGFSGLALVLSAKAGSNNMPPVAPSNAKTRISLVPPPAIGVISVGTPPASDTDTEWTIIKDYSYAQRHLILSGLTSVQARVDAQIVELRAKRATMKPPTRTADWDFAM